MTASNANQSRNLTTDLEQSFVECHVTAEVKIKAFQVSLGNCEVFLSSEADHCDFGSATRNFLLTFVSIEMSGSSPLRLLLRSISWTFEGLFTQNLRQRMNQTCQLAMVSFWQLWKVMLDYEDSWLSKRLQLFVQQGEVRLMVSRAFWQWLSFQTPHSRWLPHLQTHNGNAGRNSKRLQRSWWENIFKFKLGILKPDGFQLSKRFRMFGRNDSEGGNCGCVAEIFFPGNQAPRHRKVHERGGFVPLQIWNFCLCKLHDTTRC